MDFKCPFYHENPDGKPTVNAPCKFQENPFRKHIMFCSVCGQTRDLRFVGWRPDILLILMLVAAILYVLNQEPQSNTNKQKSNPSKNPTEQTFTK